MVLNVHHNISGYAGGNIVRTYGQPEPENIHAVQLEINSSLLMTTSRQEFIAQIFHGRNPSKNPMISTVFAPAYKMSSSPCPMYSDITS